MLLAQLDMPTARYVCSANEGFRVFTFQMFYGIIILGSYLLDKLEFVGVCNEPNRINSQERYFTNI